MRILLLGENGQLGWELRRTLAPLGEVIAMDFPDIDLARLETVIHAFRMIQPNVLVNATAYTQVDLAEEQPELAMAINGTGPGRLAEIAAETGSALIHYSTDYVFDGMKGRPYVESDTPNPLNSYGRSKLAGERIISSVGSAYWIFRTSWVYSLRRESFVTKILSWARQKTSLQIVADQFGSPTWSRMLAEITAQLLSKAVGDPVAWIRERRGLYHLAGDGTASRFDWAKVVLRLDPHAEEQICGEILPGKTDDFPAPACRPLY